MPKYCYPGNADDFAKAVAELRAQKEEHDAWLRLEREQASDRACERALAEKQLVMVGEAI